MKVLAAALCLGLLLGAALTQSTSAGPDAQVERDLALAARAYLDPDVEALWRPRRAFEKALAALAEREGIDALVEIDFLRQVVYQGRHFLPRFSNRKWQKDNEITGFEQTDGLYLSLRSEGHWFTYAVPRAYPGERALKSVPRLAPLPLLLTIHDERDGTEEHPGRTALLRRYPRADAESLYREWLVLAPSAARARFLEEDGGIRHRVLTAVLTNFWRAYHVDFDRIVVDGGAPAAAFAAAFPHTLAGLVLRAGAPIDPDVIVNYASVPVFVVGDEKLARTLEDHGHLDVSSGDTAELLPWLQERRRRPVRRFNLRWKSVDHTYARWITVEKADAGTPEVRLAVHTVDTDADPNTIRVATHGIERLQVFLSDEIVDLDRPVRLVLNGVPRDLGLVERDFGRLFEKAPQVRRNMNFGWLYTALVENVELPGVAQEPDPAAPGGTGERELKAEKLWRRGLAAERDGATARALVYFRKVAELGQTAYLDAALARLRAADAPLPFPEEPPPRGTPDAPAPDLALETRLTAQKEWLEGRPDRIERHLGDSGDAVTATHLLPFALRDLWWRPAESVGLRVRCQAALGGATDDVLADQLRWILAGGGGDPYPRHADPAADPWPVLTALVLERTQRESTGARWLPDESPVLRRRVLDAPPEWQDWYARWCGWFYGDTMRVAYAGEDPETLPAALRERDDDQKRLAAGTRTRNAWLAVLAGVLFVGGVCVVGRRVSRA